MTYFIRQRQLGRDFLSFSFLAMQYFSICSYNSTINTCVHARVSNTLIKPNSQKGNDYIWVCCICVSGRCMHGWWTPLLLLKLGFIVQLWNSIYSYFNLSKGLRDFKCCVIFRFFFHLVIYFIQSLCAFCVYSASYIVLLIFWGGEVWNKLILITSLT